MSNKLERGVAFVEFALGAFVFFAIIFGCIYISILLASKVIVTRALDAALETLVSDQRFVEDTHLLNGPEFEAAWGRVNAARTDAISRAVTIIEASWVNSMLVNFRISPPVGGPVESKIQILRPGNSPLGGTRFYNDEWLEVGGTGKIKYSYTSNADCILSPIRRYSDIIPNCPLMSHAILNFYFWPIGTLTIPMTAYQFAELRDTPTTPRSLPTVPIIATPTFTHTPEPPFPPTATPTTTPGNSPTPSPTPTTIPPPPNCVYTQVSEAIEACCRNCNHYSACFAECLTNPITYRCTGRCEGG